jgi:hypothetical protein
VFIFQFSSLVLNLSILDLQRRWLKFKCSTNFCHTVTVQQGLCIRLTVFTLVDRLLQFLVDESHPVRCQLGRVDVRKSLPTLTVEWEDIFVFLERAASIFHVWFQSPDSAEDQEDRWRAVLERYCLAYTSFVGVQRFDSRIRQVLICSCSTVFSKIVNKWTIDTNELFDSLVKGREQDSIACEDQLEQYYVFALLSRGFSILQRCAFCNHFHCRV